MESILSVRGTRCEYYDWCETRHRYGVVVLGIPGVIVFQSDSPYAPVLETR
jgi:hypothetical protein